MTKFAVHTEKAPKAIGPYSQAVRTGGYLFSSGQLPLNPATGKLVEGSIEVAVEQCLQNLQHIVEAAGGSLNNAVKISVFLTNMADFQAVNQVYTRFFQEPFPARTAIQVAALPLGAAIEIEGIFEL